MKITTTRKMGLAFTEKFLGGRPWEEQLSAYLSAMTPEAKRDLAAELLRSASKAEGFSE